MKTSERGKDLIKEFEGLSLVRYTCPVGKLTIGYGRLWKEGMPLKVTKEQAEAYFEQDVAEAEKGILNVLGKGVTMKQGQFDAFVSFVFNFGLTRFTSSTLLKKHRAGDYVGASNEFPRWNKGTVDGIKKPIDGLTRRRKAEQKLYMEG